MFGDRAYLDMFVTLYTSAMVSRAPSCCTQLQRWLYVKSRVPARPRQRRAGAQLAAARPPARDPQAHMRLPEPVGGRKRASFLVDINMHSGRMARVWVSSLGAFWPAMQALAGARGLEADLCAAPGVRLGSWEGVFGDMRSFRHVRRRSNCGLPRFVRSTAGRRASVAVAPA